MPSRRDALGAARRRLGEFGVVAETYELPNAVHCLEAVLGPAHELPGYTAFGVAQLFDPEHPNLALVCLIERRDRDGALADRVPVFNRPIDRTWSNVFLPTMHGAFNVLDPTGKGRSLLVQVYSAAITSDNLVASARATVALMRRFERDGQLAQIAVDFDLPLMVFVAKLVKPVALGKKIHHLRKTDAPSNAKLRLRGPDGPVSLPGTSSALDQGLATAHAYLDAHRRDFPVMPGALPGLGHFLELRRHGPKALARARAKVGPLFWVHSGFGARHLYLGGAASFELLKNRSLSIVGTYDRLLGEILGEAVLLTDGPRHERMRTLMARAFAPREIAEHGIASRMAHVIEARCSSLVTRTKVRILEWAQELTLEMIFGIVGVHSRDFETWRRKYRDLMLFLLNIPVDAPGFPLRRAREAKRWIDATHLALIEEARRGSENGPPTILTQLVRERDAEGRPLSDIELLDNLRNLVLGGHETTSSTMAWMVIHLAKDPRLWNALREEATAAPSAGIPTTRDALRAFPIAEAIFRETLRMHSPGLILHRRTTTWLSYAGREIPPETPVGIGISELGLDPAIFDDPASFSIERWLGRSKAAPTPIELAQFGGGVHFCLGYHLALIQAVQFLVGLAQAAALEDTCPHLPMGREPRAIHFPVGQPDARSSIDWRRPSRRAWDANRDQEAARRER